MKSTFLPKCAIAGFGLTIAAFGTLATAAPARAQAGQTTGVSDSTRLGPSRQQLEALAAQRQRELQAATDAKSRSERQAELTAIQERLRDGDFQPGDRIALTINGDSLVSDTAIVRGGRVLQIRNLPSISLQGVLHSELQDYLTKQLSQYLKNPQVQATSLVQIAILGPVGHPGFFSVPADMTLSDAIMMAGGPTQGADVNKTVVRRDNKVVKEDEVIRQAFASGTTLDQLSLRAGDQIVVGEKSTHDWLTWVRDGALALGAVASLYALTHR